MRLPAFNSAAVKHFVGFLVNFVRLIGLYEFLHVFRVFVVFASHDQVYVWRVFIFNEDTVFSWRQANLAGVRGVDNGQGNLRIVQRTWQLRCFQLNNFQIFRVLGDVQNGWQQANTVFQFDQATFCSSSRERPRLVGSLGTAT